MQNEEEFVGRSPDPGPTREEDCRKGHHRLKILSVIVREVEGIAAYNDAKLEVQLGVLLVQHLDAHLDDVLEKGYRKRI